MTRFELISLIIGAGGILIIWLQVRADHERRKKIATITFLNEIRPIWFENERKINQTFGKDTLKASDIENILKNDDIREIVRKLLGHIEYMSVGINTGVFDKQLLYRMSASYFINIYHQLRPYIKYIQDNHNQFAYIEFTELVIQFEDIKRTKPDPRGRIKFS